LLDISLEMENDEECLTRINIQEMKNKNTIYNRNTNINTMTIKRRDEKREGRRKFFKFPMLCLSRQWHYKVSLEKRERGRFYYYYYYYCGSTLLLGFDNDIPHLTVFLFTQLNPLLIVPTSYVLHVAHISQIQLASNPSIQNPVDAICLM